MRAVIQRVSQAQVQVEGKVTGQIGRGLLVYLGLLAQLATWDQLERKVRKATREFQERQDQLVLLDSLEQQVQPVHKETQEQLVRKGLTD